MKKLLNVFAIVMAVCLASSCDKTDCNGDLDGMWQMMLWTDSQGDTIATKDEMIFYSFQLQMMQLKRLSEPSLNLNAMFENKGNAIRVYNPQYYKGGGHDEILGMEVLQPVGVPHDGIMQIVSLSGGEMTLRSDEYGTLKFRKY